MHPLAAQRGISIWVSFASDVEPTDGWHASIQSSGEQLWRGGPFATRDDAWEAARFEANVLLQSRPSIRRGTARRYGEAPPL